VAAEVRPAGALHEPRRRHAIDADPERPRELDEGGQQQCAGAGAEIEDGAYGGAVREDVERRLDEGLRVRPRDEGRRRDGKVERPEARAADDAREGLARGTALDQLGEAQPGGARVLGEKPRLAPRVLDAGRGEPRGGGGERLAQPAAARRAASSSAMSASISASKPPAITRSMLWTVSPMRWSVTRSCGKL
jgi:hypothetical protein